MQERRKVIEQTYKRYQKADRVKKSRILDEFVEITGYNRAYAAMVLRQWGTTHWVVGPKGPLRLVAGQKKRRRRRGIRTYDEAVKKELIHLWYLCDCMCGKRLVPAIHTLLPVFQRWGEIQVQAEVQEKLMSISAATADRLLVQERKRIQTRRGKTHTRSAPWHLTQQIPLRTFDEWDRSVLGQVQADLVGHDGGVNLGQFAFTCTVTELCVGWTELRPLQNKARVWVTQAMDEINQQVPFHIIALGTDTGSEFVNNHLFAWSKRCGIRFTRTRPYRKNDNCFVEEKNNSVVRRTVGYLRYDREEELVLLQAIYQRQTLLCNYFYPSMKLIKKTRHGSRVYRQYDTPQTPYQRLLTRKEVPKKTKEQLTRIFNQTNPAMLKRELTDLQDKLFKLASSKPAPNVRSRGKELVIRGSPG
jgi:hypothetical protein